MGLRRVNLLIINIKTIIFLLVFFFSNKKKNNVFILHRWKGDWSDYSDKWTEENKEICGWNDEDDGIFWMPVEKFV
jgi:putative lipase involved disintegration of autophagic bodies